MPSPGSRQFLERGARALAIAALGALLWRAFRPPIAGEWGAEVARVSDLPAALARAVIEAPAQMVLAIDSIPGARERGVARAVGRAGTPVRWRLSPPGPTDAASRPAPGSSSDARAAGATGAPPVAPLQLAAVVEPLPEPSGRVQLTALSGGAGSLTVADDAGVVDSTGTMPGQVRQLDATIDGRVRVQSTRGAASTARRDSVIVRRLLVIGRAGWEAKFTLAALEEAGWEVDARLRVGPQAEVRQGEPSAPDTSRYAAVIVLDDAAEGMASALGRYVRSGGGAIVAPRAAAGRSLGTLLPARAVGEVVAIPGALRGETPRRGLGGVSLAPSRPDAVALERTGSSTRIVAARAGAGRIVQIGYDDTWRWRMEGNDDGAAAHRAWWSGLVRSVAYAPLVQLADSPPVDEAPFPALVEALGPPMNAARSSLPFAPGATVPWERILFALMLGSLLVEWSSRRLRGAR